MADFAEVGMKVSEYIASFRLRLLAIGGPHATLGHGLT